MRRVVTVLSTVLLWGCLDEGEDQCSKPPCPISKGGSTATGGRTQNDAGVGGEAAQSTGGASAGAGGSDETQPDTTPPSWLLYTAKSEGAPLALFATSLASEGEDAPAALRLSADYGPAESLAAFEVSRSGERVVYRVRGEAGSERDLFFVDLNGGEPSLPVRINSPLPTDGQIGGAWLSDDGQKVAYLAKDGPDAGYDLFAVDLSGVTPSIPVVLNERTNDLESVSSAGPWLGASLLFTVTEGTVAVDEHSELYLANVADFPPREPAVTLSSDAGIGEGTTTSWLSPGRGQLVYARGASTPGGPVLAFLVDGLPEQVSEPRPLVGELLEPLTAFRAIWAPDDTQLAYEADGLTAATNELFWLSPSAEVLAPRRLNEDLPAGSRVFGAEAWSPDSSKLVFAADEREPGEFQLLLVDLSGDEPAAPVPVSERIRPGQSFVSWSPDGRWVVFTTDLVTPNTLELFAFDTTLPEAAPVRINTALAVQEHPVLNVTFAPQGARLYYSAEQSSPGAVDLFTVDLSGAAPTAPLRINTGTAPDRSAIVSHIAKDSTLFFLESQGASQSLFRLAADSKEDGVQINEATLNVVGFALAYP